MPLRGGLSAASDDDFDFSGNFVPEAGQDLSNAAADDGILSSDEDDAAFIAAQQAASNRRNAQGKGGSKKTGSFQSMGLNANLIKAITRKGFSVPTPIQRKAIPLIISGNDVVGMARTGSGKTAAFVIPMIEKLKGHTAQVGVRAIVLSPSRELALQTLKGIKEFGKGTDLRSVLLVGGDSLEDQFGQVASNPDIIVATPGRLLHLLVEMSLELSLVRYVVFDEADRLFEMGFATQLTEILHALPTSRQTLLFSATLPKSLVEFAKAGLREPRLVRLDAESKISPDLQSAFLTIKADEKESALLHILDDVIGIPRRAPVAPPPTILKQLKREAVKKSFKDSPTPHSTIVFAATKHHVEYLATLLNTIGFAVSFVYGSLDQRARQEQVENFRAGVTNVLVVTDVAARGIDIPMLANVINYDMPSQPKIYVHRVGRTARAGQKGWSYSLIQEADVPYLLDLQLFLARRLAVGRYASEPDFSNDIVVGKIPRTKLDNSADVVNKLLHDDEDLQALQGVAIKGEKLYKRTRSSASAESAKRSKAVTSDPNFAETSVLYPEEAQDSALRQRDDMLARISGFRPAETVFEIGRRGEAGKTEASRAAESMRKRRLMSISARQAKAAADGDMVLSKPETVSEPDEDMDEDENDDDDDDFEVTVSHPQPPKSARAGTDYWLDAEHFMSYQPLGLNHAEERGYGVHSGSGDSKQFAAAARGQTMDLDGDESKSMAEASRARPQMRWDKRGKKYVSTANDADGSRGNTKLIRSESGQKLAGSFKSGRFEAWRKKQKVGSLPRAGDREGAHATRLAAQGAGAGAGHYRHRGEKAAKPLDKYRDDYDKKRKKIATKAAEVGDSAGAGAGGGRAGASAARPPPARKGRPAGELRSADDIRRQRKLQQRRRDKNARPPRRKA